MVNKWSKTSHERLSSCHVDLQRVFNKVLIYRDCSVLEGERGAETQNKYYAEGKSRLTYPHSMHNKRPSLAVDVVPYPVPDWNDPRPFIRFGMFVIGLAAGIDVNLRWGGDWDRDFDLKDQRFNDYPHFELHGVEK